MKISIIAAVAKNRAIGKNNDLIWKLPDDMKFFKEKTSGHLVIMGRRNYESLPSKWRPLPNRINVLLTRNKKFNPSGTEVFHEMEEAISFAKENETNEIFIIGGSQIYELALPFTDKMYLTEIDESFDGDVFFPEYDKNEWVEIERIHHQKDERHAHSFDFVTYERKQNVKNEISQ